MADLQCVSYTRTHTLELCDVVVSHSLVCMRTHTHTHIHAHLHIDTSVSEGMTAG